MTQQSDARYRSPGLVVARNAALSAARFLLAALIALWVTRYMLSVLGLAQFGVWALAGAILPILRLLDLGLGRSLTRTVAQAKGAGAPGRAAVAMGTARCLALGLSLLSLAVVFLLRDSLVALSAVPADLAILAAYVVAGTALVAAIEGVFAPYQAALEGLGRLDLTSTVDTAQRLASTLGVVLVLGLGWGLPGLVWKNLVTALGAGLTYRFLLGREAPALARARWGLDRGEGGRLLAFGRHVQTVNLAALLVEPFSKVLLSRSTGLEAVAAYDLALRVSGQAGGAFLALGTALFPAAAELQDRDRPDPSALVALYRPAARYLALLALPTFGLLIVLAPDLVSVWLGPAHSPVAGVIQVLGLGWLVAILALPAFLLAQAGGHVRLSTLAGLTTAGVSLGVALVLVPALGLAGAAWAGGLGLAAGGVVAVAGFAHRLGLGWAALAVAPRRAWLAALLATALAAGVSAWSAPGLAALVLGGVAGLGVYFGALLALRVLGPGELSALWALITTPKGPGRE